MFESSTFAVAAALPLLTLAQLPQVAANGSAVMPIGKYRNQSGGIRAKFIRYSVNLFNMFIKDVNGIEHDIVLDFDNASYYAVSKLHPRLCRVPGRNANRS